jgi:alpha-galactosidase
MRRLLSVATVVLTVLGSAAVATGYQVAAPAPAYALDNGLGLTPAMGFNDWNAFGCDVSEQLIKQTADFFVSSGLKAAGYQYVNIDDCWMTHSRDANGRLVPDPVKFPDGIAGTAGYVHSLGLKLGIYEDAGTATCAGYPGSLGHETVDAQTFADWGVDYLKYDNCNNAGSTTTEQYIARYSAMRDALAATGRPIYYSLCEWGVNDPASWAAPVGNSWRTTGDISDNWASLASIVDQNMGLYAAAGPGHWNDPDMLEVGNGGMTDAEYRTHFGLWAMMAAPLLIGTDLRKATPATMDVLLNREVIALDQDSLGRQAKPVTDSAGHVVFARPLANGDVAVALYNPTGSTARIATTAAAVGLRHAAAYDLRDVWRHATTESGGTIAAQVPAHGPAIYRVSRSSDWAKQPPATSVGIDVPAAYPGSPVTFVKPGRANPVGTSFTDDGRAPVTTVGVTLTAPPGWTVDVRSAPVTPVVPGGRSFGTKWTVTPPAGTPPGSYDLTATAVYGWGGRHWAETTSGTTVVVPTAAPTGTSYLSDLAWMSASNGWGPVERDASNGETAAGDGRPLTIGGVTYAKGLGAHAPSEIDFYLGGACSAVGADVGVDDEVGGNGEVTFQLYADAAKVADSGPVTGADPAKHLAAAVSGAQILRLVIDPDGANSYDHSDWAGARVTCAG